QSIRYDEALLGIAGGDLERSANIGETSEPVEHARQSGLVFKSPREGFRTLEVVAVLRLRFPCRADVCALEAGIDLMALALRRARERSVHGQRMIVVPRGLGIREYTRRSITGQHRVFDRVVLLVAPRVVVGEDHGQFLELIGVEILHTPSDHAVQSLSTRWQ